jgi:hypothetical protein
MLNPLPRSAIGWVGVIVVASAAYFLVVLTSSKLLSAWPSRDLPETQIAYKQGDHGNRIASMRV